jgi:hypothetical protein
MTKPPNFRTRRETLEREAAAGSYPGPAANADR